MRGAAASMRPMECSFMSCRPPMRGERTRKCSAVLPSEFCTHGSILVARSSRSVSSQSLLKAAQCITVHPSASTLLMASPLGSTASSSCSSCRSSSRLCAAMVAGGADSAAAAAAAVEAGCAGVGVVDVGPSSGGSGGASAGAGPGAGEGAGAGAGVVAGVVVGAAAVGAAFSPFAAPVCSAGTPSSASASSPLSASVTGGVSVPFDPALTAGSLLLSDSSPLRSPQRSGCEAARPPSGSTGKDADVGDDCGFRPLERRFLSPAPLLRRFPFVAPKKDALLGMASVFSSRKRMMLCMSAASSALWVCVRRPR
mmetsp:Transcript_9311/g.23340  ORF Transcript_9311/g.23340 Transcript_9311/m.23340 type:complete len:312 (-) Transcript_9311:1504-2439(-)